MLGCALLLIAGSTAFLMQAAADPDPRVIVRRFAEMPLEGRCDRLGSPFPAGDPCTDSRGYRFVLHKEGRFDIYLISGEPRHVVSGAGDGLLWSPDRTLNDGLLAAFSRDDPGA
jgi:hypothetical protein